MIHVGAAAPFLPTELVEQLAQPGRMFIPIGDEAQDVWQIDKDAKGSITQTKLFGVRVSPPSLYTSFFSFSLNVYLMGSGILPWDGLKLIATSFCG